MANCLVISSGWIWVSQTQRRNRTSHWIRITVVWQFTFICTHLNLQVKKIIWNVTNSCWRRTNTQKACCPFQVYASLFREKVLWIKVRSWTLWIDIDLVEYGIWHGVCCLFAPKQWNRKVSFRHYSKYAVCSMRKGWKRYLGGFEDLSCVIFERNKSAYVGWNLLCK